MEIRDLSAPLRVDDAGAVRVGDTRVTLTSIVACWKQGDSPEAVVEAFPVLSLQQVYATYAYVLQHQEQVEAYVASQDEKASDVREATEEYRASSDLRQKILSRKQKAAR